MWCIKSGVLHTSNNGFDKDENPIIPFLEYLQDIAQTQNKKKFIELTNEMLNDDDIKLMPKPMFFKLLKDISFFRANFDEWKNLKYKFVVR